MALFTKENAAEMARKAVASRLESERQSLELLDAARVRADASALTQSADLKVGRIQKQIELLDIDIENPKTSPETRVKLISAKGRLWELIYPKPGSLKLTSKPAKASRSSDPMPEPAFEPSPIPTQIQPVQEEPL